jgi:hypothetical protein
VNEVEKDALKHCQIDENYYHPYPRFSFHVNQKHFPFYPALKFNHPNRFYSFWNTKVQEKWSEEEEIARFLETRNCIDCPSSVYQEKLQAAYNSCTAPYTPEDTPRISNCYSVQPARKCSLFVNQIIKHICFSDVTTYHSPPYEYTRNHKDPSKQLAISPKSAFNLFQRRQATTYYYLVKNEGRTPPPNTKWVRVRLAPTRRFRINLQGTFMNRAGRDMNKVIFPAPRIAWYFKLRN